MSLKTRCIKEPQCLDDGLRISIMSRHTLNDGKTPDKNITKESYDEHWPLLSPPPTLIGAFYKRNLPWKDFEKTFKEYLESPEVHAILIKLIDLALVRNVTILCIEKTPEQCHRRLVAEKCKEIDNRLNILMEWPERPLLTFYFTFLTLNLFYAINRHRRPA